jgi:hypothetical protein
MQQKDIIYIDVEDDITSIIGKVKHAKQKIVALVPPKRTGVLQSSVNLKLLARAAEGADKRLVLITHNAALAGLAASADIPVAKTLQSRPEIAKLPSVDDNDEDVIDGDQLPVGDHAGLPAAEAAEDKEDGLPDSSIDEIDIDGETSRMKPKRAAEEKKPKAKKGISVPDFGDFRKKLAIGAGGGILLILFLFWAFAIAPHATIVVSAKTTSQSLSTPVTLGPDLTTDSEKATIKTIKQEEKVSQSVDFEATGTKNVGEKATGSVKFTKSTEGNITVPVGTQLTSSSGKVFVTNSSVTVPGATLSFSCPGFLCPGTASVNVTAKEGGTDSNGASGTLSGSPQGTSAALNSPTSGGTDRMATIVTQEDVEKAKENLADQNRDDALKKLKAKFDKTDLVIEGSFAANGGDPTSAPAIGQEVSSGKAKLTSEVTYTMVAVGKDSMNDYLDTAFEKTLTNKDKQRIYKNGFDTIEFADYKASDDKKKPDTATLTATAQVGPKINDSEIIDLAKGKRSGEIIGDIKAIDGVSDVEVKLSPFWVGGVPDDAKKINVEFKLLTNG